MIIGANRGIGRALLDGYVERGWECIATSRKEQTPEDNVPFSIETLDDLIKICQCYDSLKKENKKYKFKLLNKKIVKKKQSAIKKVTSATNINTVIAIAKCPIV